MGDTATAPLPVCLVCLEPTGERCVLPALATGNGQELRPLANCTTGAHVVCRGCMRQHVTTRINDMRVHDLRCPATD